MHLLVATVCVTKILPISQNEMLWWLRLQIVTITRPVNRLCQCLHLFKEKYVLSTLYCALSTVIQLSQSKWQKKVSVPLVSL